jgi:hypothetical protein
MGYSKNALKFKRLKASCSLGNAALPPLIPIRPLCWLIEQKLG